jgi:MiaB-like tRNA modifying enzyme
VKEIAPNASLIGPYHVTEAPKVVEETLKGNVIEKLGKRKEIKLLLPKRRERVIDTINICCGCENFCSYCITKFARGNLFSYPKEDIVKEVKLAVKGGCKEIRLTGQDCGVYGKDLNYRLPDLLEEVCKIPGFFRIRVGMMGPSAILEILDDLVTVFKHEKIYKFLHVPVQSGNDEILQKMNRNYTVRDFERIIEKFRKEIPEITISTDIIVGFPHENEKQFEDSLQLVKRIRPSIVNISRFMPRPKTLAAKMAQLPGSTIKKRSRILTELCAKQALAINVEYEGKEIEVLVTHKGWKGGLIGRTPNYKPVVLKGVKLGDYVKVKIVRAYETYLEGILCFRITL